MEEGGKMTKLSFFLIFFSFWDSKEITKKYFLFSPE